MSLAWLFWLDATPTPHTQKNRFTFRLDLLVAGVLKPTISTCWFNFRYFLSHDEGRAHGGKREMWDNSWKGLEALKCNALLPLRSPTESERVESLFRSLIDFRFANKALRRFASRFIRPIAVQSSQKMIANVIKMLFCCSVEEANKCRNGLCFSVRK